MMSLNMSEERSLAKPVLGSYHLHKLKMFAALRNLRQKQTSVSNNSGECLVTSQLENNNKCASSQEYYRSNLMKEKCFLTPLNQEEKTLNDSETNVIIDSLNEINQNPEEVDSWTDSSGLKDGSAKKVAEKTVYDHCFLEPKTRNDDVSKQSTAAPSICFSNEPNKDENVTGEVQGGKGCVDSLSNGVLSDYWYEYAGYGDCFEEYEEVDGKYYKVGSLSCSEIANNGGSTDSELACASHSSSKEEVKEGRHDGNPMEDYIERDEIFLKYSPSFWASVESDADSDNSTVGPSSYESANKAMTCTDTQYINEEFVFYESDEEIQDLVENFVYFDNALKVKCAWSRFVESDEDRNEIYDQWMNDLVMWERNRLMWLDSTSCLKGFDSFNDKDRTFLVKAVKDPVNPEAMATCNSFASEGSNESLGASDVLQWKKWDVWYKLKRIQCHKVLFDKGLPNWYEDLVSEQNTEFDHVLNVGSYGEDELAKRLGLVFHSIGNLSVDIPEDIALVYQFTDRTFWRRYHKCYNFCDE